MEANKEEKEQADETETPAYHLIDISIKRLVRDNPSAFLELIGFTVAPNQVAFEDTAIQQRERRADHVCLLKSEDGTLRGVLYLEYQLIPDSTIIADWLWKWVGLVQRFPVPVVLLVIYMHRGNYATFHPIYRASIDPFETVVHFDTVHFWECAPQIRSGKYPDFIPLLPLCEEHPTEATVREQVALIQGLQIDEERKQELLSLSFLIASRDIARGILLRILREVYSMNTIPTIIDDMFGNVLRQRELQREKHGEAVGTRDTLLRLYTKRLGTPSPAIITQLETIDDIEVLRALIDRYDEQIESWEQLLHSTEG